MTFHVLVVQQLSVGYCNSCCGGSSTRPISAISEVGRGIVRARVTPLPSSLRHPDPRSVRSVSAASSSTGSPTVWSGGWLSELNSILNISL